MSQLYIKIIDSIEVLNKGANMKKIIRIFLEIIVLISITVVVNFLCKSDNIMECIDEKIVPILVGIMGASASFLSMIKPIFSKFNLSKENYDKSLIEIRKVIQENEELKKILQENIDDIEIINNNISKLIEMVKIGFTSDEEMVKNGNAEKICSIGDNNEV